MTAPTSSAETPAAVDLEPLPLRTLDAEPFWAGCRAGVLLIQRCAQCAKYQFYPRVLCTTCGSDRLTFEPVGGRAEIYAFTVCHRPLAPRFADQAPYVVALVDLEEGPRLMTNIVGCAPEDLRIGLPVQVTFAEVGPEVTLPMFEPVAAG